jgi:hypothetical protein
MRKVIEIIVEICFWLSLWILVILIVGGCATRKPLNANMNHNKTYVYWYTSDGAAIVVTRSEYNLLQAQQELGCRPCVVGEIGTMYRLEKLK